MKALDRIAEIIERLEKHGYCDKRDIPWLYDRLRIAVEALEAQPCNCRPTRNRPGKLWCKRCIALEKINQVDTQ